MWPVTHTEITTASPEAIWALWENVPGWIQWDEGLEAIQLDGPFAVGTPGKIRPTGGPPGRSRSSRLRTACASPTRRASPSAACGSPTS